MLETELRLGLPGGSICNNKEDEMTKNNNGKRGFSETESSVVDLKLNLSSTTTSNSPKEINNNVVDKSVGVSTTQNKSKDKVAVVDGLKKPLDAAAKPPAKAQVVGWPPVRSFRKNIVTFPKKNTDEQSNQKSITNNNNNNATNSVAFIKVSMDGAPYLRKIDLKLYKSYQDLSDALAKMFSSFTIGDCGTQGMKDFMNESKLIDILSGSEYVATYEDKDGDWMLVGDVPWPMFVESCKRLRIMKGPEATGLGLLPSL